MLSGRTHHCEFSWFLPHGVSSVVLSKESPHTASKRGTRSSSTVKTMTKGHFRQNQALRLRRKSWCRKSAWILWSEGARRFDICCVTLQDIPLVGTTSSRLCCDPNWESGPSPAVCGNKTRRFLRRTAGHLKLLCCDQDQVVFTGSRDISSHVCGDKTERF